jgi:hypothetical protein
VLCDRFHEAMLKCCPTKRMKNGVMMMMRYIVIQVCSKCERQTDAPKVDIHKENNVLIISR